jgi:hypothetical protein
MNGISLFEIVKEQFYSNAPSTIARVGLARLQLTWVVISAFIGTCFAWFGSGQDAGASILAANAVFTALSVTMAMFFWPRAINLKNDPEFVLRDERWHVYRLTTQLFWTVLVGVASTGLAVVQLAIPTQASHDGLTEITTFGTIISAISVGLTAYQVMLLGQSVFRLYAATFWMPRA